MTIILPATYLGPISYYAMVAKFKDLIIEQYEYYEKQTYRNRCCIYSPNGLLNLTIPVIHEKKRIMIKDARISYRENWQKVHWKSLETAYMSSPYFEYYEDDIRPIFEKRQSYLAAFNLELFKKALELLNINRKISFTKTHQLNYEDAVLDLRNAFSLKPENIKEAVFPRYHQVFENKYGFMPNLSIADLLFNQGPKSLEYLKSISIPKIIR